MAQAVERAAGGNPSRGHVANVASPPESPAQHSTGAGGGRAGGARYQRQPRWSEPVQDQDGVQQPADWFSAADSRAGEAAGGYATISSFHASGVMHHDGGGGGGDDDDGHLGADDAGAYSYAPHGDVSASSFAHMERRAAAEAEAEARGAAFRDKWGGEVALRVGADGLTAGGSPEQGGSPGDDGDYETYRFEASDGAAGGWSGHQDASRYAPRGAAPPPAPVSTTFASGAHHASAPPVPPVSVASSSGTGRSRGNGGTRGVGPTKSARRSMEVRLQRGKQPCAKCLDSRHMCAPGLVYTLQQHIKRMQAANKKKQARRL